MRQARDTKRKKAGERGEKGGEEGRGVGVGGKV